MTFDDERSSIPSLEIDEDDDQEDVPADTESESDSVTKRQQGTASTSTAEEPNLPEENKLPSEPKKKKKSNEACGGPRQRALDVMKRQLDASKQFNEKTSEDLSDIIEDMKGKYNHSKKERNKSLCLMKSLWKHIRDSTTAYKEKLNSFEELHANFKTRCEKSDMEYRVELDRLGTDLDEDISKLKQKLIKEIRSAELENLQKAFEDYYSKAMENDS